MTNEAENNRFTTSAKELIDFSQNLMYENIPQKAIESAKRLLLDSVATILLGSRRSESKQLRTYLYSLTNNMLPTNKNCTVIGTDIRLSSEWAAFGNASFSQIFDFNDGYSENDVFGGSIHPGRIIIPVCLSAAEKYGVTGKDLITGIIVGYETALRIRGINPSPVSDVYGGAAGASKIMLHSWDKMLCALGIAASVSPRNFPEQAGEYDTDFLRMGYKAKASIDATLLADYGFTGPPIVDDPSLSTRFKTRGLYTEFLVNQVYTKPYPTCRVGHGALDTLRKWRKENILIPESVRKIKISLLKRYEYGINFIVEKDSYYKIAQYSIAFAASCAAVYGNLDDLRFDKKNIGDPKIHSMLNKIEVVVDDDLEGVSKYSHGAIKTEFWTSDNQYFIEISDCPRGDPDNPMSNAELFEKLVRCSDGLFPESHLEQIYDSIMNIDTFDNIIDFMKIISISVKE
jgi:2-methylcitrate dehydratase PrpD